MSSMVLYGFRTPNERNKMYLTTLDIFAVIIALVMSITFVITTGIANAKLTASRDYWRSAYYAKAELPVFDGE